MSENNITIDALKDLNDRGKPRCQVMSASTNAQCNRTRIPGYDVCELHKAYKGGETTKLSPYTKNRISKDIRTRVYDLIAPIKEEKDIETKLKKIKDRVAAFEEDPDLHNLDKELAYLKDVRLRIENLEGISEPAIIELVTKNIDTIYKCYERRQKIILSRNYVIELEELKVFIKKLVDVINNRVEDIQIRELIKGDIFAIYKNSLSHRRNSNI